MRPQETYIAVSLGDDLGYYPQEVWSLNLTHLDMYTEDVLDELAGITWAEGNDYPNYSAVSATTGERNWGASGSYSEILMQVSTGAAGGVGTLAITAAIKVVYEKLRAHSQSEGWRDLPTAERAAEIARSRLHQHYEVASEKLTVVRSDVDLETQRYDLEFVHEDGRRFGATIGALTGLPWCTRVWVEGADPGLRPLPPVPDPGN
ncbi:hypothetical protein [Streptomyces sp. NBC_01789]|uniref:hypothetical protein n=1 Tax=Streptomyces sp. NBC_01789 TaxID=2975941 RepID=UPI002256643D|nr:hypothetical protein [Streptomyces sp. NBC_01789]MCX4449341.1 hypothetical protein [Streptomyces sp. NBC_01789]